MCVIIFKKSGLEVSRKELEKAWKRNPDGAGFAYWDKNRYVIKRSLSLENFLKLYFKKNLLDKNVLIHFRIKTHGGISLDNTHPFEAGDLVFAHNGIIVPEGKNKDRLDTLEFRDNILNDLPNKWWEKKVFIKLIEEYVGSSRLVFLNKDEYIIINEDLGTWVDGIWYSNRHHINTSKFSSSKIYHGNYGYYNTKNTKKTTNSSLEILKKAMSEKKSIAELTISESFDRLCWHCGVPLLTSEEKDGVCIDCMKFEESL